jgi:hypothetical protein
VFSLAFGLTCRCVSQWRCIDIVVCEECNIVVCGPTGRKNYVIARLICFSLLLARLRLGSCLGVGCLTVAVYFVTSIFPHLEDCLPDGSKDTTMDIARCDRGANSGICSTDMMMLEGSAGFVDVRGLASHNVNQLRIVTSQSFDHTA